MKKIESDIEKFHKLIYSKIKKLMDEQEINTYSISKKNKIKRSTFNNKLLRLSNGKGISTISLYEIAEVLEVSIETLMKR